MKTSTLHNKQRGVVLVMTLLFLLILTIISLFAATSSSIEFKMAGNMQDSYASFQASEAGITTTLGLSGHATADPFDIDMQTNITDGNVLSTGADIKCDEDGIPQDTDGMDVYSRTWADDDVSHPLKDVFGGPSSMSVCKTMLTDLDTKANCDFLDKPSSGDECHLFDIRSTQRELQKVQTTIHLGVVKTYPCRFNCS